LPPLQVIDDFEDIARVLILTSREGDQLVPLDVIEEVVIDGLEALIENFEMIPS
jgi:hypothetical protein